MFLTTDPYTQGKKKDIIWLRKVMKKFIFLQKMNMKK